MTFSMRSILKPLFVLILILLTLFASDRVNPQITGEVGSPLDTGKTIADMSFFSADDMDLKINSTDDVFAAGGTINVDTTSADHLVIAGGEISVRNISIHDLIVAGGKLNFVSGNVEDDIVVAGGEVHVLPGFGIGGSAVIAGGDARVEAPVPTDLRVAAGRVYLNSAVGGNARLSGDTITLGPKARIGGDLLYRTDNLTIKPGAVVSGRRMVLPAKDRSAFERWGTGAGELFAMFAIAVILGFVVMVVVIGFAVPGLMRSSAQFIRSAPLKSLGIGVLIAVCIPFLMALLFTSGIGAPLAMLLGAICLAITPVAIAATAYLFGMEARKFLAKADGPLIAWTARLFWPALGAAAILVLGMIPLLGLLVWLFAMLFGLGAVVSRGGKALAMNA